MYNSYLYTNTSLCSDAANAKPRRNSSEETLARDACSRKLLERDRAKYTTEKVFYLYIARKNEKGNAVEKF